MYQVGLVDNSIGQSTTQYVPEQHQNPKRDIDTDTIRIRKGETAIGVGSAELKLGAHCQ